MTTPPPPFWTLAVFIALGYGLLWWLVNRASRDRWLQRIVLMSYSVHALLAVALYAISYWRWPILQSLQTQRGFWSFGLDAFVYHYFGTQIAEAWKVGFELPDPELGFEYFALVAGLYRLLGSHPLYPILLNGWLAAVNGLLVYLIGNRLFDRRTALWGGLLVSCWPSSFIWSAQLLKDTLSWFLVCAALLLIVSAIPAANTPRRSGVRWVILCLLLGIVVIALTRLRFYVGSSLSLAAMMVLIPAAGCALLRKQIGRGAQCAGIVLLVVASTLFARTLDTFALLSPANPEAAHYALALQRWERNQLDEAAKEFYRTLALRPGYQEASLAVAAITIRQARWEEAIRAYKGYVQHAAPEQHPPINILIARLYVEAGNDHFRDRRMPEAIEAYEHAIAFDPSRAVAFANLGLALARTRSFERAFETSAYALELSRPGAEEEQVRQLIAKTYVEKGNADLEGLRSRGAVEARLRVEAAIEAFERALTFDPQQVDAMANLGMAWTRLNAFERAFETLKRALELSRTGAEAKRVNGLLAQAYVKQAREDLRGGIREAAQERRSIEGKYIEAAIATCEQAFAVDPSIPPPSVQVGLFFTEAQEFGLAHQMFERAFEPTQPRVERRWVEAVAEAYLAQGDSEFSNGHLAEAITAYERAVRLDPFSRHASEQLRLVSPAQQQPVPPAQQQPVPPAQQQPVPPAQQQPVPPGSGAPLVEFIPEPLSENGADILRMALTLFSSGTGHGEKKVQRRKYDFSRFDDQAFQLASQTTPESLAYRREGFVAAGGYSLMDPWAHISTPEKLLRYLPRALAIGLLAPFPWQWFQTQGSTGVMRTFAGVEMVLLYLLVPGILAGVWRVVKQRRAESLFLLAFIAFTAVPLSLVVANLGTLFRIRLLFLLPLLVIAGSGEPLGVYGRMARWVKRVRRFGTRRAAAKQEEGALQPATTLPEGEVSSALVEVAEEPGARD